MEYDMRRFGLFFALLITLGVLGSLGTPANAAEPAISYSSDDDYVTPTAPPAEPDASTPDNPTTGFVPFPSYVPDPDSEAGYYYEQLQVSQAQLQASEAELEEKTVLLALCAIALVFITLINLSGMFKSY